MIQVNYNELQENPDGDYQRNPASITTVVNEFVDEQYSLEINVEGATYQNPGTYCLFTNYCFMIFCQVSRRVTVLLKTGFPAAESLMSTQKYPSRSN